MDGKDAIGSGIAVALVILVFFGCLFGGIALLKEIGKTTKTPCGKPPIGVQTTMRAQGANVGWATEVVCKNGAVVTK